MINDLQLSSKKDQLTKALILLGRFQENGDQIRIEKTVKLIKKIYNNEFIIAFSGHFSAGKSSMINALIGDDLLPSSPIPTSANLVKVHEAECDFAKVYHRSEKPLLFEAPYDYSTVKEYCKREDITEIEIGNKRTLLPKGVTVMDTPGVDSTDEAHRISTESALHLADVVFYVMDYNHVQSELNFLYTRNLLKYGVNLNLIINQIDKHNEAELSFHDFKKLTADSFLNWDVDPAGIYYTSLKNMNHPENEFATVKMLINEAFKQQSDWIGRTVESAFARMIEEHKLWLEEQMKSEAEPLEKLVSIDENNTMSSIFEKEEKLKTNIDQLKKYVIERKQLWTNECDHLLKNSYLMPFETRELAGNFLLANQKNFKVGLIFAKKKTNEERNNRLQTFSKSVGKQVESQINWHLREWATTKLTEENINDDQLQLEAQKLTVKFEESLFIDTIKKGAGVTGEYILHYCEEVADSLKKIAKTLINQYIEKLTVVLQSKLQQEIEKQQHELHQIEQKANALRTFVALNKEYKEKINKITLFTGKENHILDALLEMWEKEEQDVTLYNDENMPTIGEQEKLGHDDNELQVINPQVIDTDVIISNIENAIIQLKNEQGFRRICMQLTEKVERLKKRNYTIALFGAFSAGKSSFANALLGEHVLPVSPNPTTAAINRICPTTKVNEHGTAMIYFKTEAEMLADISNSFAIFGYSDSQSLDELYSIIPKIVEQSEKHGKEKIHLSFLTAFYKGYKTYKPFLGKSVKTNLVEFQSFVSNEAQSCFVESIDLFYDCEITQQGITLVDTPGADSINARHTGVAFDYIKNADAILFVTYYNHAFAKADREFLIQLGRVKDAFELDKMFFIVNAIDLANSEQEIVDVLDYVQLELVKNRIRAPKLFGVSSKLAINENTRTESNIQVFLDEFASFLKDDLSNIALQSAVVEYKRIIAMLDNLIESGNVDEAVRQQKLADLQNKKTKLMQELKGIKADSLFHRFDQELKELLFYVKQRVFFRFSNFFKEAFNPAVLKGNQRHLLMQCLNDLLKSVGYDFAQELRATSLRLERYLMKMFHERLTSIEKELQNIQQEVTVSQFEIQFPETPHFSNAFEQMDRHPLEQSFKYFKNPRSFFEQNEKKKMEEALQARLSPLADEYLKLEGTKLADFYKNKLADEFEKMITHMENDLSEQYDLWIHALSDRQSLEEWMKIRTALRDIE